SPAPAVEGGVVPYSRAFFDGAWRDVPVVARESLRAGSPPVVGPALIGERHCATVVEPGWTAGTDAAGALVMRRDIVRSPSPTATGPEDTLSAVDRELFTARFTSLAEEMGEMLRRTALSVNVKERLDFSCALLGPDGDLVASAAHIPVHLGALGLCVRALRERVPMAPGDVLVTNHPAFGGSHLPDVTVVTPVHDGGAGMLLGYVASRAHHAEIGGTRPGSMPPDATRLADEGVVIPPTHLFRAGVADRDALTRLLTGGPHPTRSLADNLADVEAAVAANRRGADALRALAAAHGADRVHAAMEALADRADALLGEALARRASGRYEAADALDDGSPLRVAITLGRDAGGATIDFTGTGATHPGNLNATPAIVRSAVLYVLRLLVNEPLPLNEGLLRRVRLVLPPGSLLSPDFDGEDPARCPAVVGGNTETSQRVVDLLLEALGLAANSQGTMNNILFGSDAFGYYETVCGGAGATPTAAGASAVHTHMTNTRITDPEVLERRCPVRVERFAVRRGSGGAGRHPGGDGAVREIAFLAPVSLSVLTQHRVSGPRGAEGGGDGKPGRQRVIRADG
ncbi:MAG TPA: hydantoinase B/oxoprolinase family protein, partial [Armatimonadaceae bacterium]|nr:hydantoinase B/oxoprolinase family protein [Armatimonadaceae bacterium]